MLQRPALNGDTPAIVDGTNAPGAGPVRGCRNCHGPGLTGEPPTYPYLASQHASYFREAMAQWKSGARDTDPSGQMPQIAKRLSDADVAALGEYLASLPPPQPLDAALAPGRSLPPATTRRSPSTAAASAGSTPQRGAGTSGEGPTTGGAHGPGGSQPPSGDRTGNPSQTGGSTGGDPHAPSDGARR